MNRVAQHSNACWQSHRHLCRVRAFERLQSIVCAGLLAASAFSFSIHTAEAQQSTRRTNSRPATTGATASDLEQTEFQNPRLRAHFQSNNVLKSVPSTADSESVTRRATTSHNRAEQRTAWAETADSAPPTSALKRTPSTSTIQRASFEQPVDNSIGSSDSETTTNGSMTGDSKTVTPIEPEETPQGKNVEDQVETASMTTPAPAFLDLSGENGSNEKRSGKAIGEHGAELSIETSPQHVLYRAVAWIVIALCMFSLAALGVRKWQRQRGLLPVSNGSSRVLETLSLGPGRAVSLIEMSGYRALVAFDAGGIKQLVLAPRSFDEDLNLKDEPEEIVKDL